MREVAEVQKELDAQKAQSKMPMSLSELGSERDTLRADYAAYQDLPKEGQKEPEKQEPEPEPEKVEVKAEPEKKEYTPETPSEEKTVPYGALKEEREKRKELSKKVRDLEDAFKQAAEDNKKLVDLMSSKSDDEPITDYEKVIKELRTANKSLQARLETIEKGSVKQQQQTEAERLAALVKQTDTELAAEGFKGFEKLKYQVIEAMDAEEVPPEERNPKTWKRVFKEIVYPELFGEFQKQSAESKKAEKEAAKKEASLIKTPGKPEAKKPDEDTSPEAYARWREKLNLFSAPM